MRASFSSAAHQLLARPAGRSGRRSARAARAARATRPLELAARGPARLLAAGDRLRRARRAPCRAPTAPRRACRALSSFCGEPPLERLELGAPLARGVLELACAPASSFSLAASSASRTRASPSRRASSSVRSARWRASPSVAAALRRTATQAASATASTTSSAPPLISIVVVMRSIPPGDSRRESGRGRRRGHPPSSRASLASRTWNASGGCPHGGPSASRSVPGMHGRAGFGLPGKHCWFYRASALHVPLRGFPELASSCTGLRSDDHALSSAPPSWPVSSVTLASISPRSPSQCFRFRDSSSARLSAARIASLPGSACRDVFGQVPHAAVHLGGELRQVLRLLASADDVSRPEDLHLRRTDRLGVVHFGASPHRASAFDRCRRRI